MKSNLKGKIISVEKIDGGSRAKMIISANGKVENPALSVKHDIDLIGTITIKGIVADEMKIGAILSISISDEEL